MRALQFVEHGSPEQLRLVTLPEVVFDSVGGVVFEKALGALGHRRRLVEIGSTGRGGSHSIFWISTTMRAA
ncbi:MAG: hypothetical protein WDN49_18160 [Acetobacteraceae bacterium]